MSEYELLSLLQTQVTTIGTELMDYFTILTAFLVAGYVAAHRIPFSMALFVALMFTVSALFFAMNVMGAYAATKLILAGLRALPDTRMAFLSAQSPLAVDLVADVALLIMLGGIVGGVFFFFQSRYLNRRANAPSAAAS